MRLQFLTMPVCKLHRYLPNASLLGPVLSQESLLMCLLTVNIFLILHKYDMTTLPKRLAVIGAGVIGTEYAISFLH